MCSRSSRSDHSLGAGQNSRARRARRREACIRRIPGALRVRMLAGRHTTLLRILAGRHTLRAHTSAPSLNAKSNDIPIPQVHTSAGRLTTQVHTSTSNLPNIIIITGTNHADATS